MSATAVARFTPLDEALGRLEAACSPVTGIVTHVVRTLHGTDHASLPNHACRLASARHTLGAATVEYGSGAAVSHAQARAAALGEALERYSATYLPTSRLLRTTARALGGRAVPPGRFALFHPAQLGQPSFPFAPFTEDTELAFVEGVSLADGAPAFAPAELVFLRPPPPSDRPIAYPTSSGLACAPTAREAALAALLELVERDAVMLAWNASLSLPRITWDSDPTALRLANRFFEPTGLRYAVVDGSAFLDVPVAIAVVHGAPGSGAALAVGAGCAAEPRAAWLKSLSEGFGVHRWLCSVTAGAPDRAPPAPEEVQTFDDHMLFYARDEEARLAAFLDASPSSCPLDALPRLGGSTPEALLDELVHRLARRGVTAYAFDATSPDVRSLGLHVVRAVAPELCQLDVSHTARFLGGERLFTAPSEAGLASRRLRLADVNPHPHPFP